MLNITRYLCTRTNRPPSAQRKGKTQTELLMWLEHLLMWLVHLLMWLEHLLMWLEHLVRVFFHLIQFVPPLEKSVAHLLCVWRLLTRGNLLTKTSLQMIAYRWSLRQRMCTVRNEIRLRNTFTNSGIYSDFIGLCEFMSDRSLRIIDAHWFTYHRLYVSDSDRIIWINDQWHFDQKYYY